MSLSSKIVACCIKDALFSIGIASSLEQLETLQACWLPENKVTPETSKAERGCKRDTKPYSHL